MVMPPSHTHSPTDADTAYEAVMDAIVTQKLAPSQKVSENVLTDMFNLSRTAARNLMERLTAQQFLVSLSPRVTRVAPLTLLEVKQNFAMRKMLDPELFVMAAPHVEYGDLFALNAALCETGDMTDDDTALRVLKTNKDFNLKVCEKVSYPLLVHWVRQLEDTTMRIYWVYIKTRGSLPFTPGDHGEILRVMQNAQADRIRRQIVEILSVCEERVLNAVFSSERFHTQDLRV